MPQKTEAYAVICDCDSEQMKYISDRSFPRLYYQIV